MGNLVGFFLLIALIELLSLNSECHFNSAVPFYYENLKCSLHTGYIMKNIFVLVHMAYIKRKYVLHNMVYQYIFIQLKLICTRFVLFSFKKLFATIGLSWVWLLINPSMHYVEKWPNILQRFLKYVWSFSNVFIERLNCFCMENTQQISFLDR